jgi:hypothetical protein
MGLSRDYPDVIRWRIGGDIIFTRHFFWRPPGIFYLRSLFAWPLKRIVQPLRQVVVQTSRRTS